ncbi:phytoene desaturase family protein [uncultured Ilyobacter sp.]|uniref:phytoene desaturase family protein n=1 Tax=uncultured Ilyobacter sp. TaxID=544433 RepID=UPI0029C986BA|nr:phytoene desaturase family protein [uncultured Ilyobacter sp.]
MKKIIIIGAGPGGLSAGMLLASKGYDVNIFEKQDHIGGRNSQIKVGAYSFDLGPTFFLMKNILEEIFSETGRELKNYVNLMEINPMYRLKFSEKKEFYPYSMGNDNKMKEEMKRAFPLEHKNYLRYIEREEKKFQRLLPCLQVPYNSFFDFLKPNFLKSLPYLDAYKSIYDVLSDYFTDEDLKLSFTFQAKYIGMSPWEAPGTFSIISYLEHKFGVYHVEGGLNRLSGAMGKVIEEEGGKLSLSAPVKEILFDGRKAIGVLLENGTRVLGDHIIMNADFAHGIKNLVPESLKGKYKDERLRTKKYSCSTFMLYLGLNKIYDTLPHHNIIFAKDYRGNVEEMSKKKILSDDFSFYVQNPSVTDSTLAPRGKSALYVLVPVPNNKSNIDWEKEKDNYKSRVLDALEKNGNFKNIRDFIEVEKVISPKNWEIDRDVYLGATFNLGHQVSQMLVFRPHNKLEGYENFYIVGGGTHPGSGLPTIYESGRIVSKIILKEK